MMIILVLERIGICRNHHTKKARVSFYAIYRFLVTLIYGFQKLIKICLKIHILGIYYPCEFKSNI